MWVISTHARRKETEYIYMSFRGINNLAIDAKGRLAMPTRYRDRLMESCGGHLVTTVDRDHCLLVYPLPEWEIIEAKLIELPSLNQQARLLQRLLIGHRGQVVHGYQVLCPVLKYRTVASICY